MNCNHSFKQKLYEKIGEELHQERIRQGKFMKSVSEKLEIPIDKIARLEIGLSNAARGYMHLLADHYGKKIRFFLEDL